ncbi:hypothetical protein [Devosia sp. LjRoot3]|uniref:hypothetical protein n=1 Tax=Devosia sp. LjRoot3 TaxID=3342319 RepID=UPI003ED0D6C1
MNAFTPFTPADTLDLERRKRYRIDMDRLRRSAEALLLSHRSIHFVGEHDEVSELCIALGLERHDFCALEVRIKSRRAVLICVPGRLWQRSDDMSVFHDVKLVSATHGYQVILVPENFIRRQPRLDNAMLISGTAKVHVSPTDRMSILGHLIEHGDASIYDLAGLVKHGDPISAVLHLVTTGALYLDLNSRITPHSIINLTPEL